MAAVGSVLDGFKSSQGEKRSQDFQWYPSTLWIQGINPYKEDVTNLEETGDSGFLLHQAPNYPSSGQFFIILYGFFEWSIAKFLWATSNLVWSALLLVSIYRLMGGKRARMSFFILAALFFIGAPWRNTIGNG